MKRTISNITIALLVGLVIGLLLVSGSNQVTGQGNGNGNPPSLAKHLQQSNVSLDFLCQSCGNFSQYWTLTTLPKSDTPVLVVASSSDVVADGEVQPSITFTGTFILDSST